MKQLLEEITHDREQMKKDIRWVRVNSNLQGKKVDLENWWLPVKVGRENTENDSRLSEQYVYAKILSNDKHALNHSAQW